MCDFSPDRNVLEEREDQDNDQHEPQTAGGEITPFAAVSPGGKRSDNQENQHDQKKSAKHGSNLRARKGRAKVSHLSGSARDNAWLRCSEVVNAKSGPDLRLRFELDFQRKITVELRLNGRD